MLGRTQCLVPGLSGFGPVWVTSN